MRYLLLTVEFLDDRYHGLLDRRGPPEWPPSPFRLFSALVSGAARRGALDGDIGKALAWLQSLGSPTIIAPASKEASGFTRHVPNNDGDEKFDRQERLTGKQSIPTLMLTKAGARPQVHYFWQVSGRTDMPFEHIRDVARSLVALGWGVDMAFADARVVDESDLEREPGVRWHPTQDVWRDYGMLRVPTGKQDIGASTLLDLKDCYESWIARVEHGKPLHAAKEPNVYDEVFYASAERPIGHPYRVFELRDSSGDLFRYPHRKLIHIAGMVRHLAVALMKKDPPRGVSGEWVKTYVAGHNSANIENHRQLSYLPLPSIGHVYADPGVRRVMLTAPVGDDALLDHVARRLAGQVLEPDSDYSDPFLASEPPMLIPVSQGNRDGVVSAYTKPANMWHTFTPAILPGHDDHKPAKTRALIERALRQSGVNESCEFEYSAFSRFPKSYSAHKYDKNKRPQGYFRPDYLNGLTAVHLTIRFRQNIKVPGPLAIGAGRHCGLGLFAHQL